MCLVPVFAPLGARTPGHTGPGGLRLLSRLEVWGLASRGAGPCSWAAAAAVPQRRRGCIRKAARSQALRRRGRYTTATATASRRWKASTCDPGRGTVHSPSTRSDAGWSRPRAWRWLRPLTWWWLIAHEWDRLGPPPSAGERARLLSIRQWVFFGKGNDSEGDGGNPVVNGVWDSQCGGGGRGRLLIYKTCSRNP